MNKKICDSIALVCFITAAVMFALDYPNIVQGGVSDGMFFMLCGKTWSFFFRKMMLALALLWVGCFVTLARDAQKFPKLAMAFLAAGFFIVPGIYINQISILPNPISMKNIACCGIIGSSDGPTSIYVSTKFRWPFSQKPLEITDISDEPTTRGAKTRKQVEALHQERLWKKFPETKPHQEV